LKDRRLACSIGDAHLRYQLRVPVDPFISCGTLGKLVDAEP